MWIDFYITTWMHDQKNIKFGDVLTKALYFRASKWLQWSLFVFVPWYLGFWSLSSHISVSLFQPLLPGSDKLGWDHVIGEPASPTPMLCRSLSTQANSVFYFVRLFFAYMHVTYIYIYMERLFLMFLDHTQRCITVGRTPLDEWSARRGDLYLTTHDTHNRQISMPPVRFAPTISAGERP